MVHNNWKISLSIIPILFFGKRDNYCKKLYIQNSRTISQQNIHNPWIARKYKKHSMSIAVSNTSKFSLDVPEFHIQRVLCGLKAKHTWLEMGGPQQKRWFRFRGGQSMFSLKRIPKPRKTRNPNRKSHAKYFTVLTALLNAKILSHRGITWRIWTICESERIIYFVYTNFIINI